MYLRKPSTTVVNYLEAQLSLILLLLDYVRTGSAFAIISLLIMMLGHIFAFYTLRRPRYIVKRLTSLMHFMTGRKSNDMYASFKKMTINTIYMVTGIINRIKAIVFNIRHIHFQH